MKDQEIEVKYYIADLPALEAKLKRLGAQIVQPRIHEINLRFDTPDEELKRAFKVLRLRQDKAARLTYKGPSHYQEGARMRQEIEFEVSDFEAARRFLEALGYQVSMMYEKYRAAYELDGVEITLDELPYGDFAELEGPNTNSLRTVNRKLGLDWEARAGDSYTVLFDHLREVMSLDFSDLSFENFKNLDVTPAAMNLRPADVS
jgi:adenylate cyclase class 2